MSCRKRLFRAGLIASLSLLGGAALWACGPFFPQWLITDEAGLLAAPTTWFKDALETANLTVRFEGHGRVVIGPVRPPRFKAVVDAERGPILQTADADLRDVETAISDRNLTARYAEVREALLRHGEEVDAWRQERAWSSRPLPPPEPPELAVPAGLPGELAEYLRGAIAYHRGDLARARSAWEELLARPAEERRRRSTWAAFMLGKIYLAHDPAAAVEWFERTRELADEGFPDPLGLAAASFGWQARAELNRKGTVQALKLYVLQMKTGDPSALESLRTTAARAIKDPEELERIARSDEVRPVVTAYVVSHWGQGDAGGLDPSPARRWLEALRKAHVESVPDADRLAWVAYRAGDFSAAEEWLRRAPGDRGLTNWIRAKLLLRAGKLDEAERLLLQSQRYLPRGAAPDHDPFQAYSAGVPFALAPRASGERGAALLAEGKYTDALAPLLIGGYWPDAAYVAERVLATDELRAYLDKGDSAKLAAHRPYDYGDGWTYLYGGVVTPSNERMAFKLHYLAGRRLAREERYEEALKYLPTWLALPIKTVARSLAAGRDAGRPAGQRAQALFRAACITRHQGLELFGTELEPDWFLYEGQHENEPFAKARTVGSSRHLGPTADERERAERSRIEPPKRFHYRYRGADLAREAAELLPDGSPEKAGILVTAGNWLEPRDPEAAKPFYEALLACCGELEIGRRAARIKAIPNVPDACPAETRMQAEAVR